MEAFVIYVEFQPSSSDNWIFNDKTDISKQKTYIAILPLKIVIIISVGISDNLQIIVLWRYMRKMLKYNSLKPDMQIKPNMEQMVLGWIYLCISSTCFLYQSEYNMDAIKAMVV
jgi:hypothetical protein